MNRIIFFISFLSYILISFARPYVTAKTWADICLIVFILSIIYQLVYIIYLRKKDNISFKMSIAKYFLFALSSFGISIIIYYIDCFINGVYIGFFGVGDKYYGIDAITNNILTNILFIPFLIIKIIYIKLKKF